MNTSPLIAKALRKAGSEAGAALLTAVVILLALTVMGFALVLVTKVDLTVSRNLRQAEEALNAAEVGASMCGQVAAKEGLTMDSGVWRTPPLVRDDVEKTVRLPDWTCTLVKEGLAPSRGKSSLNNQDFKIIYNQFRIHSTGIGRGQSQRTVETIIRVQAVQHHGSPGFSRIAYVY